MNNTISVLICIVWILCEAAFSQTQTVKRGRNEGTLYIPASNVMGNGDITAFTGLGGIITSEKAEAGAEIGGAIGIAGILQVNLQTSFINFNRLGPTEAHLQATIPGNDRLRFFGFALAGDLYLSTSLDTIGVNADSTKPEFNPYPLFSAIMDLDWLSRPKQLPLKTYVAFGLADDPKLLFEYRQLSFKAGFEVKRYQHSLFIDAGMGMYKEKNNSSSTRQTFDQRYVWVSPGGRYRLRQRFSLLGSLRWTVYRHVDKTSSLDPQWFSINLKFEAPLFFRETNTEAIRTMVFIEKKKEETNKEQTEQDIAAKSSVLTNLENTMSDIQKEDETFDYKKEKEDLIKRREKVDALMNEIEELLNEDKE